MDQSKFCVPRHVPGAKQFQDMARPRLHMVGAIVHGWFKAGFLVDPSVPKDANLYVEIIVQLLQQVLNACQAKGMSFPARFYVQGDNAGDVKNTVNMLMQAALCGSHNVD
eukprot:6211394-Alexandrium_andersonii.AAC.1